MGTSGASPVPPAQQAPPADEESSGPELPDSWTLHPLVVQSAPTPEELARSPALQGVQDILYGGGPVNVMSTYRTQGNNFLDQARQAGDAASREEKLRTALRLYDAAAGVDVSEALADGSLTEKDYRVKLAVIYSNRAEAHRLLGDVFLAYSDATRAVSQDPTYYKAFIRRARVCEDIRDPVRATYNYKRAWEESYKAEVRRLLEKSRAAMREAQARYAQIYAFYKGGAGTPMLPAPARVGLALPVCDFHNTPAEARENAHTLFVVYPLLHHIERVVDYDYGTSFASLSELLYGEPRGDKEFDAAYRHGSVAFIYSKEWADVIDETGKVVQFSASTMRFSRVKPSQCFRDLLGAGYVLPLVPLLFALPNSELGPFLQGFAARAG